MCVLLFRCPLDTYRTQSRMRNGSESAFPQVRSRFLVWAILGLNQFPDLLASLGLTCDFPPLTCDDTEQ